MLRVQMVYARLVIPLSASAALAEVRIRYRKRIGVADFIPSGAAVRRVTLPRRVIRREARRWAQCYRGSARYDNKRREAHTPFPSGGAFHGGPPRNLRGALHIRGGGTSRPLYRPRLRFASVCRSRCQRLVKIRIVVLILLYGSARRFSTYAVASCPSSLTAAWHIHVGAPIRPCSICRLVPSASFSPAPSMSPRNRRSAPSFHMTIGRCSRSV